MNKTLVTIICIAMVAVLVAGLGFVAYSIITSNPVDVDVNPTQAILLLSDTETAYNGDTITLTATLSEGLADQTITFLQGGSPIGSELSTSGVATLDYVTVNIGSTPITMTFTATIP